MRAIVGLSLLVIGLAGACATPAVKTETASNDRECRFTPGFGGAPGNRICATPAEWASYDQQRADNTELATQELRALSMQRGIQGSASRQYDVLPPASR